MEVRLFSTLSNEIWMAIFFPILTDMIVSLGGRGG